MYFQELLNILLLNCSVEVLFSIHSNFFSFEKFINVQELLGGKFILTLCKEKTKTTLKVFYLRTKNRQDVRVGRKAE